MSKYERKDLSEYERDQKFYRTLNAEQLMEEMTISDFSNDYCIPDEIMRRLKLLERIGRYHPEVIERLGQSFDDWVDEHRGIHERNLRKRGLL